VQVDLRELAGASIDTMASDASRRGITMSLEAPGGQCVLEADRGEMEIILNNLVSNAVKYNRDGGMVTVRLERQDGAVRISVSDTGIGMTAEEVAKLFGEFVRIRNEKTKNILGSGLGLSIVQKLANAYGGTVTVESRPDEGSTFTVTLPVRPAAAGSGE